MGLLFELQHMFRLVNESYTFNLAWFEVYLSSDFFFEKYGFM